jgi:uncharacterized SAM-binding protein YcdF (DUF218 family)
MKRAIFWLLRLGVVVYAATLFAVISWSFLWPAPNYASLPEAEAVVCLGSGHNKDGTIGSYSKQRATTCTDVLLAGKTQKVIMTGASQIDVTVAEMMADVARGDGLSDDVVIEERLARSTLQNALFSMPYLDATGPVILVTDSFHLPRSWMSFHWAGYSDLTLVAASARDGESWVWPGPKQLAREPLAIWFNLLRGGLWTLANRFGVENTAWLM